ncbi:uncharacterized protein LOC131006076 [Salvia miltiorrhiza]|uniref:uncharacterized protein LOC131006076 n=1 Tax=Salvia miltiorrhiza TaxID=226208 RepID=UPI0025ABDC22|nr:uncharacterized protein LOC131006076 [Salvia miltiorrhiza]XP_057789203.1 uncharacterized protein LOC131006076 [Salvia miltiorrhiza]XP_057789204.1 uncharacterized protein LOC131006076 [Salvia miltiorrhiza]
MEGRRRHNKWDNYKRPHHKRPPKGNCSWQPTVPSWEKEFCRVIGSMDWETLLQMKKFTHLYENVVKWDDSAGEEAFSNAKKRFWAEINGFPCHVSLPDPDLYIDNVDWDSETDPDLPPDLESEPLNSNADEDHDPVVIFGDSLFPNQAYSVVGWGDDDENFKVPTNSSSGNHGPPLMQNWGYSFDNGAAIGWPSYYNNAWHLGDVNPPSGYTTWGGSWNNDWGWNYSNNNVIYETMDNQEQGQWNERNAAKTNAGRNTPSEKTAPRVEGNESYKNHPKQSSVDKRSNSREWNSFSSCAPASHHAAITVEQTWNQQKSIR